MLTRAEGQGAYVGTENIVIAIGRLLAPCEAP